MKISLFLILFTGWSSLAQQVGDCINLRKQRDDDPGYFFRVDAVSDQSFTGTHAYYDTVQKVLPKKYGFKVVPCPTDEDKQKFLDSMVEFHEQHKKRMEAELELKEKLRILAEQAKKDAP